MNDCSKCDEPSWRSIVLQDDGEEPKPGQKDHRGVHIVRFCKTHWEELKRFVRTDEENHGT